MATQAEHEAKAHHNEAMRKVVDDVRFPDWEITTAFYEAVHYIRAFLTTKSIGISGQVTYQEFRSLLVRHKEFQLAQDFDDILELSKKARYDCLLQQRYQKDKNSALAALDEIKRYLKRQGINVVFQ